MDRHDIQSFEPIALCGLQEGATSISVQRPYLIAFDLRRINVVCHVAAHDTPPSGLFEGTVQHGVGVLDGPGSQAPILHLPVHSLDMYGREALQIHASYGRNYIAHYLS